MSSRSVLVPDKSLLKKRLYQLRGIAQNYDLIDHVHKMDDRMLDSDMGLMVLITGEGNFGKSSLINALAGKTIAPVAIIPKTFKIDVYCASLNQEDYAMVRFKDTITRRRMSIHEAEKICKEEEEAIAHARKTNSKRDAEIVEVVWYRSGLAYGSEICLVDSPGLSQFSLSDGINREATLVKGLGSTYCVEDVWEKWYHRADLVLWAFAADKMESAESVKTVQTLCNRQRKQVISVATKADQLPPERWNEINSHYQKIYGELLGNYAIADLQLTVCGGKSPLIGTGVKELRAKILALAPEVDRRKRDATQQFISDEASQIETVLVRSAEQVIQNLRVISDTADEVALYAMRRMKIATTNSQDAANKHVEQRIAGLDSFLKSLAVEMKKRSGFFSRESKEALQAEARERVQKYLAMNQLQEILNRELNGIDESVRLQAETVSQSKPLEKVRIMSSGREMKDRFTIPLKIVMPQAKLNIQLPTFQLPDMGCVLMIAVWVGVGSSGCWLLMKTLALITHEALSR